MNHKPTATSGVALVIVLGFLVIISALAVAFFSSVTTELKGARTFASGVSTRQLADSAANIVMSQIREATARENAAWASQPGMIRVYRDFTGSTSSPSKNAEAFLKLYSSDKMIVEKADLPAFVAVPDGDYDKDYDKKPAFWTDLNAPVVVKDLLTGVNAPHYPIIDPRAMGVVQGFSFTTDKVNGAVGAGTDGDRLPMPVRWIYVLQDGTLTVPTQGALTVAKWPSTTDGKMPTKDNPIVGRIAFWADDDTNKVNINTAAGFVNTPDQIPAAYKSDYSLYAGSYWDTPRFYTNFDYGMPDSNGMPTANQPSGGLAITQLLQGEYQRYPGHPATTSLGGIFGGYLTSQELWRILPRISTANYEQSTNASSTSVNLLSYGTDGGTKRITVGAAPGGDRADNQNSLPKTERLYSSVDELLFATNPNNNGGQDPTSPAYLRQSNDAHIGAPTPSKLTPDHLDRLRFFLTASSRAPELNLFSRPRITIWPVRSERNDETAKISATAAINYPPLSTPAEASDLGTGLSPYDKVMLFCSTIGPVNTTASVRNSEQAPGTSTTPYPYRYIFFRRNPHLSRDIGAAVIPPTVAQEDLIADITLPRNYFLLQTYLTKFTEQPIPGFADPSSSTPTNLKAKWDAPSGSQTTTKPNRDELLVEIFDYIRCANLQDGTSLQFTPSVVKNRYFAPRGLIAPSKTELRGADTQTGMGRFPTITEASLVFYYAGPTWAWDDTKKKILVDKIKVTTDKGNPKVRQMRAFLLLSTFNPMFGYAPMSGPANLDNKITYEVTGLENLFIKTSSLGAVNLGFPSKDLSTNLNLMNRIDVSSGDIWGGRNMGGYEGFIHTLAGKTKKHPITVAGIYGQYLGGAFNGPNLIENAANAKRTDIGNVGGEYYPFQTSLTPTDATSPYPNEIAKGVYDGVGICIPWADKTFDFVGNTSANPVVVKIWYDTYDAMASPARVRPANLNGKPYTPVQTINLVFPFATKWPVPMGDGPDGTDPNVNTEALANFDPKTNKNLSQYYWTGNGCFYPSFLRGSPTSYPNESPVTWWDEFYDSTNTKLLDADASSTLLPRLAAGQLSLRCGLEPAWSLASRINWATRNSWDPYRPEALGGTKAPPINWYGDRWRNIFQPGDTIKSLVYCQAPQTAGGDYTKTGDLRLGLVTDVNNGFTPHPSYSVSGNQRACCLRAADGNVFFPYTADPTSPYYKLVDPSFFGNLVNPGSGKFISSGRAPGNLPATGPGNPSTGGPKLASDGGVTGVIRDDSTAGNPRPGDFDTGMGNFPDGPYANKEDEGNVVYAWFDQINRVWVYPIPYFTATWAYEKPGDTFTSPLRQLPSPVMLGSLLTRAAGLKGWETLCFTPYPAGLNHPGNVDPKDHLLLDLFNMPIVEPYPISEPFSTAGKINMNYRIAPFNYITRTTALRAAMASIRVTGVDTQDYAIYKTGDPATGARLTKNYRKVVDCNTPIASVADLTAISNTLQKFDDYFNAGVSDPNKGMFKSASQICEMPLYPLNEPNIDNFWSRCTLTGDNVREKPYADLYPRLTTKSNTYTVHFRVQTLRQLPRNATTSTTAYAIWEEGKDSVLGEYRGATTIERYIDPADTRFNQWIGTTPNLDYINPDATVYNPALDPATPTAASNPTRSLELVYRFRTVNNKKFAP